MYGAETWAVKKAQEKKLDVAEMRMLRNKQSERKRGTDNPHGFLALAKIQLKCTLLYNYKAHLLLDQCADADGKE